jgi:hypothetical protein
MELIRKVHECEYHENKRKRTVLINKQSRGFLLDYRHKLISGNKLKSQIYLQKNCKDVSNSYTSLSIGRNH